MVADYILVKTYKLPAPRAVAEMSSDTNEPTQVPGSVVLFGTRSRGCTGKTRPLEKYKSGVRSHLKRRLT
jgi:hypothetical protein